MLKPVLAASVLATSLFAASPVAADSRSEAAARWIELAMHGKVPALATPIDVVFDGGGSAPCARLRLATVKTTAELATLTGCLRDAAIKLAVDKQPAVTAKDLASPGVRYLRSWFAKPLHRALVIPRGQTLWGTSFNRPLPNTEASGVAVMLYVVVDGKDQITGVYAYAGRWEYPI